MDDDLPLDSVSPFDGALAVDLDDPEVARARAAIASRLLGTPKAPAVIGRYIIVERLGAGGMGIVYAAFDPELDRKVALKLLFRRDASEAEQQRLVREAKAMAKLAHPNVVTVYDAGEHEGRVFVAIELVHGKTLRAWTKSAQRPAREVLAMCVQAGRGLAAAHAAGIIHRDFKPDNVLIGEDGRARVLDFGLARRVADHEDTSPTEPRRAFDPRLAITRTGAVHGTPGYIAPEQLRGAAPDVLGDQFSFCATVWEALTGALPYPLELHADPDATWRIVAPPRGRMPRWVERVLRRGLAEHDRYARLDELLRALRRDPAKQRLRIAGAVAMLASIGGAFAIGLSSRDDAVEVCAGGEQVLSEAWPPADREGATAGVTAVGSEYAGVLAPRLQTQLAGYASAWVAQHREACLAHRRGEQSAELLDRRMTCLHRGKRALVTVGRLMRAANETDLPGIVLAAGSLPDPALCDDLEGLAPAIDPPPAEARPIAERLAEAQTLLFAAHGKEALPLIEGVLADARALGHGPLVAEALLTQGKITIDVGDRLGAAVPLREAVELGLRSGADEVAVEAWGQQAWAIATGPPGGEVEFPGGRELIVAIADRRPKSYATVSLYNNLAGVELAAGNRDGARAMYERVRALAPDALDRRVGRVLAQALAGLAESEADPATRARLSEQALALMAEAAGAEHPRTLSLRRESALLLTELADVLAAMASTCNDTRRMHGDTHPGVATCSQMQALLAELHGDAEQSRAATRTWARAADSRHGPMASAYLALREGDHETAAAAFAVIVAELDVRSGMRPWWIDIEVGEAEVALGRARRALGRPEAAATIERGRRRIEGDRRRLSPRETWLLRYARAVEAGTIGST